MTHNNERIFSILEKINVSLLDRMYLGTVAEDIDFSDEKLSEPINDLDYFKKNQYLYVLIQNGEELCIEHIDPNQCFIAYRKSPGLYGTHELLYYVPSSHK